MAPDTKVPDGKTDGRKDGQRQNNIQYPPMAGDNNDNIVTTVMAGSRNCLDSESYYLKPVFQILYVYLFMFT